MAALRPGLQRTEAVIRRWREGTSPDEFIIQLECHDVGRIPERHWSRGQCLMSYRTLAFVQHSLALTASSA